MYLTGNPQFHLQYVIIALREDAPVNMLILETFRVLAKVHRLQQLDHLAMKLTMTLLCYVSYIVQ